MSHVAVGRGYDGLGWRWIHRDRKTGRRKPLRRLERQNSGQDQVVGPAGPGWAALGRLWGGWAGRGPGWPGLVIRIIYIM